MLVMPFMETKTGDNVLHDLGELNPEKMDLAPEGWGHKAAIAGNALWDVSQETFDRFQDGAVRSAKATDKAIRENPYQSLGIAFGVGLLLGCLCKRP